MKQGLTRKVKSKTGKTYHAYVVGGKILPRHLVPTATHLREEIRASVARIRDALSVLGMSEHADTVVAYALSTLDTLPAKGGLVRNDVSAKVADDLKNLGLTMPEQEKVK